MNSSRLMSIQGQLGKDGFPAAAEIWPSLGDDEVHVWIVRPDASAWTDERLLSADELERAARFASRPRRRQFADGRVALRTILGRYLDVPPETVAFGYEPRGKLWLPDAPDLAFNLSHSDGLSVVAVGRGMRIGADVEMLRDSADFENIARRFFAASEADAIGKLPKTLRTRAFLTAWTRKEALAKATGDGIASALGASVPTGDLPAGQRISHRSENAAAPRDWFVYAPEMPAGYVASIAISRRASRLAMHEFTPSPRPE